MFDNYYRVGKEIVIEGPGEIPLVFNSQIDAQKVTMLLNMRQKYQEELVTLEKKKRKISFIYNLSEKVMNKLKPILAVYTGVTGICLLGMMAELILQTPDRFMGKILLASSLITLPFAFGNRIVNDACKKKLDNIEFQEDYLKQESEELSKQLEKQVTEVHHSKNQQPEYVRKIVHSGYELNRIREELLLLKEYCCNKKDWDINEDSIATYMNEKYEEEYSENDESIQKIKKYINERTTK